MSCYKLSVVPQYRIAVMVKFDWCRLTDLIPLACTRQCISFKANPSVICPLYPLQFVGDQDPDGSALSRHRVCEFKVNNTVVCGVGTLVQKF